MTKRELFHGTTARRVSNFLDGSDDLFGVRYPDNPSLSATLTDDPLIAKASAVGARMVDGGVGMPVILRFQIPEKELVPEGQIGNNTGCLGYSTVHTVDPHELPEEYLQHFCITVEDAVRDAEAGNVIFYRIPKKYFCFLNLAY